LDGAAPEETALPEDRFINRELSWLEFGARLLGLAADDRLPLFERVKFLSIFAEGLDEFFQVRVAGLEDQVAAGLRTRSPDGMSPAEQLAAITRRATDLIGWQSRIFGEQLAPALEGAGVIMADWHTLDGRRVQPLDLPGPDPAGRRPRPPVPLHLQPLTQPGGAGGQSAHR
jgi:polyphosphate kinase